MIGTLLTLTLFAAPKIQTPKIEVPKVEVQKLDLKAPALPKADGLSGPARPSDTPEPRRPAGDLRRQDAAALASGAKVESVIHAREFSVTASGRKPVGRIDALTVNAMPAKIPPFRSCVRLASGDGRPITVATRVRSPSGEELLSSRAEVTFGNDGRTDLVVEWDGFQATTAGDYKVLVSIDGAQAGEFLLPVRLK